VEGIAAGGVLGDQVRAGELGQQRPHLRDRDASEAGGGAGREVGAGVEPEQPEQLRRASAEGVVGPGEHRPQVGGGVPGVELVEAVAGLAELVGQGGERELWVGGGAGGDDGQRQGQPRAAGDELVGGVGFGDDPVVAEPAGQQLHGFVAVEQVEGERLGASGDQARELVAAGHQQHAAGCAGQQRGDLVGVAGVVQQDQHGFAGQQAAVQACLGRQADGDLLRRHLQRVQESPYRLGGYHRRPGRVEPAQVDVQLAIGEPVGDPVRPVDRQGGLADASGPGDHGDHHRARRRLVGVVEQPVQRLQRHLAAAERVGVGGELPWHHPSRWRTAWQPGRPAGEQVGVDPLQLRAGVGAELLGEADPDRLVPLQRLGRPAGPLQNHQQAHPQRLPQREALGQLAQLGHQVDPGPAGQIQVDAPLQAGQVSLLQPRGLRMFQPVRSHPLERGDRHSPSAATSRSRWVARSGAAAARSKRRSKRSASTWSGSTASAYPPPRVATSSAPSRRRRRRTLLCTFARASTDRSSPHTAVASRSTDTGWPADSASTASSAGSRPAGSSTGRPATETCSGPSSPTSTSVPVTPPS
jgi:hypothetical protein